MNDRIPLQELAPAEVGELDLYEKRERIYTRAVEGFFQRLRLYTGWPLLVAYFGLPWLNWDDRPAIWFDLPARKFYILAMTFWPQDFPLLAWLMIISAFVLFAATMFAGRVWCGYTCPQTVWTSIFMWAEQFSEGTRNQRIKLDKSPWSFNKIRRKTQKHAMWLGFALFTGFTFVGYFSPVRDMLPRLISIAASQWELAWIVFFTLATYINAGWLREQVCIYMCPYARFQSVMFDSDTLIVSYDPGRGEARGSRRKGADPQALDLGDCIDCKLCVQVCPTGIDIRDGLQHQCITCALCIDACDSVMDKMEYPRGLIRYTTENRLEGKAGHILRPRLIAYLAAIVVMSVMLVTALLTRIPVGLDAIRERGQLYSETSDGMIENVYTLKIRNMSDFAEQYQLTVRGLRDAVIVGNARPVLEPGEVFTLPVRLQVPKSSIDSSNVHIVFGIESTERSGVAAEQESRFLAPAPGS